MAVGGVMSAPPLARATDYGREYVNSATGEAFVSITTALKAVAKPDLNNWIAKVTSEYCDQNWDDLSGMHPDLRREKIREAHLAISGPKADLGSAVHSVLDNWAKGIPSESSKQTDSYVNQFTRFLMDYRPRFIETEVTVGSRAGYAGTADAIAEINGKVWILDWKSGGVYEEYGMQLAALRNADYIINPDGSERAMPKIDFSGLVRIRPRSYKFIPVYEDEACFSAFLGALEVFRWFTETKEHVLGEAR